MEDWMQEEAYRRLRELGFPKARELPQVVLWDGLGCHPRHPKYLITPEWSGQIRRELDYLRTNLNTLPYLIVIQFVDSIGCWAANVLCVSSYEEDQEYERRALRERTPLAYVINLTIPDCTDMGSIWIVGSGENVRRVR